MAKMLDLIKSNAVPATVMRSAAKGALSVSGAEMIEILVYLTGNPVLGQEARMTLAQWDPAAAFAALSRSDAAPEVLEYFWMPQNRRPALLPALIENPRISEARLMELAGGASREVVVMLLASPRVQSLPDVLQVLLTNPQVAPLESLKLREQLGLETEAAEPAEALDVEIVVAHQTFEQQYKAEIVAEEGKPFELTNIEAEEAEAVAVAVPVVVAVVVPEKKEEAPLKLSVLQKIANMTVAQRVKSAFLGNKEERSILIRDGSKVVQNAVMASPKLSESEVENFAAAKNVQENVLREIARNRRFIKSYTVIRNLVSNPRCPLDISLGLMKNLLINDLRGLQMNKNVPDTVRKVAYKLYKEKSSPVGQ
jgi:hypothetical protein